MSLTRLVLHLSVSQETGHSSTLLRGTLLLAQVSDVVATMEIDDPRVDLNRLRLLRFDLSLSLFDSKAASLIGPFQQERSLISRLGR